MKDGVFTVTTQRALSPNEKAYLKRVVLAQFPGVECVVKDGRDLAQPAPPAPQRQEKKGARR